MNTFITIVLLIAFACLAFVAGVLYVMAKRENTLKQRGIIDDAIYAYQVDMRSQGIFKVHVKEADMEDFDATLYRWWDWGYTRILPVNKYNIIKPYIRK